MIDVKWVKAHGEEAKASQVKRGLAPTTVDDLLMLAAQRQEALETVEAGRRQANSLDKAFQQTLRAGAAAKKEACLEEARLHKKKMAEAEEVFRKHDAAYQAALTAFPNIVAPPVPAGDEDHFTVLATGGKGDEKPGVDHQTVGEKLGLIDIARGVKVAGTRNYYLKGEGALLELGLQQLALKTALEAGFTPIITPTLARRDIMEGAGFITNHEEEIYKLAEEDLFLTGTSEVALAGLHAGEVLPLTDGPLRYVGFSTCYRREAGAAGRDTRGIMRVHQFNKVEMFVYCRPEEAEGEHEKLLALQEVMLGHLEVPYRVIDVAAGDLGLSAARKFDCEAWMPSEERYREMTSTSNCTTFQARRLQVRYEEEGRKHVAATLNGTLATTRWLTALIENHHNGGRVRVPQALQAFVGKEWIQ